MGEHLLSGKLAANIACGADSLRCSANRVRAPQERLRMAYRAGACGGHIIREHVPAGKLTVSIACGTDRLPIPLIRVRPPQEFGYRKLDVECTLSVTIKM